MDKETKAILHFNTASGERESDRLVAACLEGLAEVLDTKHVKVDGKLYEMKVLTYENKVMFDILNLPEFNHIEFVIRKTG